MKSMLSRNVEDLAQLLPKLVSFAPALEKLGAAMLSAWNHQGKVLIAGNGGSAADAMHFAEDLCVRFQKNRRALAAMALADPTVITCAANDFGYESIFTRQLEAFGNPGDVFIAMTTSGNSENLVRAIDVARKRQLVTCGFLGRDGGALKGKCDIEIIVPSQVTARIQEAHKLLYHVMCEWVESKVD